MAAISSEGAPQAVPPQGTGTERGRRFSKLRKHPVMVGSAAVVLAAGATVGAMLEFASPSAATAAPQTATKPVTHNNAPPAELFRLTGDPCNAVPVSAFQHLGAGTLGTEESNNPWCSQYFPAASGLMVEHFWLYQTTAGKQHNVTAIVQEDRLASAWTNQAFVAEQDNLVAGNVDDWTSVPGVGFMHVEGFAQQSDRFKKIEPTTITTPSGRQLKAEFLTDSIPQIGAPISRPSIMIQANSGTPDALDIMVTDYFADPHTPGVIAMAGAMADALLTPVP